MVIYEPFTINEKNYVRAYSDSGMMIHGGVPEADYSEACDPAELGRTYTETDIPIETDEGEAYDMLNVLLGGAL